MHWRTREHNVVRCNHADSNVANGDHWKNTKYIGELDSEHNVMRCNHAESNVANMQEKDVYAYSVRKLQLLHPSTQL